MKKVRLDQLVFDQGLSESREVLPETNLFRAPKVPYGHAQEDPIRIYLSDQMPKQEL